MTHQIETGLVSFLLFYDWDRFDEQRDDEVLAEAGIEVETW